MTFQKKQPLWLIKLLHFEYWNLSIFIFPMYVVHIINALRCRTAAYISVVNITEDFMGENKQAILETIPEKYRAKSFLINRIDDPRISKLNYPIFLKPNLGERGFLVKKIYAKEDLLNEINGVKIDFIVQEAIEYPIEVGVFFIKKPNEKLGKVTSITTKGFLSTVGNGLKIHLDLLEENPRARFQKDRILNHEILKKTPLSGIKTLIEPVGNHSKGTIFLNGNYLINNKVHTLFNEISKEINGLFYGRFDIKVPSYQALETGEGLKILELNLVMAEPTHIYDPSNSIWKAYKDMAWHWWQAGTIARQNIKAGYKAISVFEIINKAKRHVKIKEDLQKI